MAGRKLDLIQRVSAAHDLPMPVATKVVEAFLDTFIEALASEGRLELREFGTFRVRERKSRMGRNPRTGAIVELPPRRRVSFKMGRVMKRRICGK
ncbi:MAG: HU family DNA-binding protein [Planctomycetes bacterium]|nr:HU family DNA-binding protein [Planctomycetota bacterium]